MPRADLSVILPGPCTGALATQESRAIASATSPFRSCKGSIVRVVEYEALARTDRSGNCSTQVGRNALKADPFLALERNEQPSATQT